MKEIYEMKGAGRSIRGIADDLGAALADGHRGRHPPNAVSDEFETAVVNLARTHCSGANHTHPPRCRGESRLAVMGLILLFIESTPYPV